MSFTTKQAHGYAFSKSGQEPMVIQLTSPDLWWVSVVVELTSFLCWCQILDQRKVRLLSFDTGKLTANDPKKGKKIHTRVHRKSHIRQWVPNYCKKLRKLENSEERRRLYQPTPEKMHSHLNWIELKPTTQERKSQTRNVICLIEVSVCLDYLPLRTSSLS